MSLFITFEGPEGAGKSTQARLLYEHLQARDYPVILTREPGGTPIGELIRRILMDLQHTDMAPITETLLFSAARAQLVHQLIRPYLDTGGIVICDRYADSTYAYQGYGLGRDLDELHTITTIATGGLLPDLTILLDISAEEGLARKQRAQLVNPRARFPSITAPPQEWNRLDARDVSYHQRVVEGFHDLMHHDQQRWRCFDAQLPIEQLAVMIATTIEPLLSTIQPLEPAQ